ncbi:MAG: TIGR01777 family oxidoreductase [Candidatus Omnitrophica bacterium]|nr:TIGR01777 family oxidoreductase [Candidatus Omnitrophota bacterium]
MRFLITGGTGFIGKALCRRLVDHGHQLLVLTRQEGQYTEGANPRFLCWDPGGPGEWQSLVERTDVIVHLAGEPVAGGRWTAKRKTALSASRINSTRALVSAMAKANPRPSLLINASAVGYYGHRRDEELNEGSVPGKGFLSELSREWENAALEAESLGVRVVMLRLGAVLGPEGGMLEKMVPPFRFFMGGVPGSGRQWLSWVHLEDVTGLIEFCARHEHFKGPINATSPNPCSMKEFCSTLGQVLKRPSWLPIPGLLLKLGLGQFSDIILNSQKVKPAVALELGYNFRYPDLRSALEASVC